MIGNSFLNILDKDFPPHNKVHQHFKRTNVKNSYTCMPIMNSHIDTRNYKVLNDKPNETEIDNCNCHNKDTCLLPHSYQKKV